MIRVIGFVLMLVIILALPAVVLRFAFAEAWKRWLSALVGAIYGCALVLVVIFLITRQGWPDQAKNVSITLNLILMSGLLVVGSALIWWPLRWWVRRRVQADSTVNLARREILQGATTALPAVSVLFSPVGVRAAMQDPVIRHVKIPIDNLPVELEGLRVLQLTDVHLGVHIDPVQFEKVALAAQEYNPDLVVLTGDIADDYGKLGAALEHLELLKPPLGVFACIGNHEIYRGRDEAVSIYLKHGVTYLCSEGKLLEYQGAKFWLAGADDPARLFRDRKSFLKKTIESSLQECPDEISTQILLCHRPTGFDAAAELGVSLTLSGHTHGGQVAMAGRSLFEPFMRSRYLLGHYQRGESHLYTSAGLGHWLPFRLNCPCEGALIELKQKAS